MPRKKKPQEQKPQRSGTLALLGRPNAGKSTLLNALLGERLAIVSHHPQTTRDSILGIIHREEVEYVLLDTPGLHRSRTALGARMNAYAKGAADQADVIVYVAELPQIAVRAKDPNEDPSENPPPIDLPADDRALLKALPEGVPVVLAVNKIDKIKEKAKLLRVLAGFSQAHDFAAIVPISAKKGDGVERVLEAVQEHFEERAHVHDGESLTDRPARYFVSEYLREQILLHTDKEVPHGIAVVVERWQKDKKVTHIGVVVHVDKESHRPIILGKGGARIKSIATRARHRIERLLDEHVALEVTVRVTPGWYQSAALLDELGYQQEAE